MPNCTRAEARKEINRVAKDVGLVFKRQDAQINGWQAYMFANRLTGLPVAKNFTFWSAYEKVMSGYVSNRINIHTMRYAGSATQQQREQHEQS